MIEFSSASSFDYLKLWQNPLSLLPYAFLMLAIVSLWLKRHTAIWGSLLLVGFITGVISHRLEMISLIPILALGLGCALSFKTTHYFLKVQFGILTFFIAVLILLHKMPGFNNLLVAPPFKITADAIPFSLYFNFDKPLIGLFILAFGLPFINGKPFSKETLKKAAIIIPLTLASLIGLSLFLHYVRFEAKWSNFFYIFAINNLLLTCVTEEALFRGFIQRGLSRGWVGLRLGNLFALIIAATLFGLMHYWGGITYVILSSIAGLFYGIAYLWTNRIEVSIACHFLVNITHFIFFTYPALTSALKLSP